jgi:rRNA small subunit pseudouridine methyltransferase Nep1
MIKSTMPLILILVDCGIELIPSEIKNHSSVQRNLKRDNYAAKLLDNALHHSAMLKLKDSEKRGRPDITHNCLLNALGSSLNKEGQMMIFLHTFQNEIYQFNPEIKLPRNYNRFKGLMSKLLSHQKITFDNLTLISRIEGNLNSLIKRIKNKEIIIFSSKGELIERHLDIFDKNPKKNYIAIVGGFQKGGFSNNVLALSNKILSISNYSLDAWVVVNKIISFYEIIHDIL